ncbi:LmbE family protein [Nostoc punctiforme NIES-2108]|uniref:LmbE family protein n=1 Tax=Nostoc punctiforme NIES-2108 TaxID=1356359 RepID=A0A367R222_NOSPU|nr:LmbE family protein [Nostoc punctiforme NIES-2108]
MQIIMYLTKIFYKVGDIPIFNPLYIHAYMIHQWLLNFRSQPLSVNQKSAIIFSPHQDDETLGCGGLIALKREMEIPIKVIFLTDGQKSHTATPWIKPPDNLIQVRKQEATTALHILGVEVSDIHFFELTDSTLSYLTSEQSENTIKSIVELIQTFKPGEIYVPHRKDNHSDHECTYKFLKVAVEQSKIELEILQYSIWIFWLSPLFIKLRFSDLTGAYRLCINSVLEQKKRAVTVYKSQAPILPPRVIKSFLLNHHEIFFKTQAKI